MAQSSTIDEEIAAAFKRLCEKKNIKASTSTPVVSPSPAVAAIDGDVANNIAAPVGELSAFQKRCLKLGLRVGVKANEHEGEEEKNGAEEDMEPKREHAMKDYLKKEIRPIDSGEMFKKACAGKGVRVTKPGEDFVEGGRRVRNTKAMVWQKPRSTATAAENMFEAGINEALSTVVDHFSGTVTNLEGRKGAIASTGALVKVPSTEFTVFPNLPYELRENVWKHSFFPRIIICGDRKGKNKGPSYATAPAVLYVCRQSREVGLKHYSKVVIVGAKGKENRCVYFDYEEDLFHSNNRLPTPLIVGRLGMGKYGVLRPSWSQSVKNVSLLIGEAYEYSARMDTTVVAVGPVPWLWLILRIYFPALEELVVVGSSFLQAHHGLETAELDKAALYLPWMVDKISGVVKRLQADGGFTNLKLSFKSVVSGTKRKFSF